MKNKSYNHLFHRDLDPFNRIIVKEKKFEIRLNDEKRQKVKIWDKIKWVLRNDKSRYFISEITGLSYFKKWEDLFYSFWDKISDWDKKILQRVYSWEKLEKYWILVMHFKLLFVK